MPDPGELNEQLGLELSEQMWELALTHRSYAYENGGIPTNERLEFLGDSVLGLIVTDTLYRTHPDQPEGQLARMRAAVVNARSLADVARTVGLGPYIRLGNGERSTGGSDKSSILADTTEAVLGAVYLELGLAKATDLIHQLFDPVMDNASDLGAGLDWKSSLQELSARLELGPPEYLVSQSGPPHDREFEARVRVGSRDYGPGTGRSKKEAEHIAAATAWRELSGKADS
jgi:ribonuclease III